MPKIPSYRITDVARVIGPSCEYPVVGLRPGEKIHEEMITSSDSLNTVDLGGYYAILPSGGEYSVDDYCKAHGAKRVSAGFCYNSGSNEDFLTRNELRKLIAEQLGTTLVDNRTAGNFVTRTKRASDRGSRRLRAAAR